MTALLAANSNAQPATKSRGLYTYLVRPVGAVATIGSEEHPVELSMRAAMVRRDGTERLHQLRVRPTEAQPDIVERVTDLLSRGVPVRMVVRFENVTTQSTDGTPRVRVQAVADTLLEPARAPQGIQLDLFS